MAAINVTNVRVLDTPANFKDPFRFEITFECLTPLEDDIEWKIIYVGASNDAKCDQILDSALIGPLQYGAMRFVFEAPGPDIAKIPTDPELMENLPSSPIPEKIQRSILEDRPRISKFPIEWTSNKPK